MINSILKGSKEIIDAFVKLDLTVGFKNVRKYVFLGVFVMAILNVNNIATGLVNFFMNIVSEIHSQRMEEREKYMTYLIPILADLRSDVRADRVLYFEFHNSEENLDGTPFKFFDLMKSDARYGTSEIPGIIYKDINAAMYTEVFDDLREGDILYCKGFHDHDFRQKYKGIFELFNENDKSQSQVLFSVPGIKTPIGFIVLEWMEDETVLDIDKDIQPKIHNHIARIALISTKK